MVGKVPEKGVSIHQLLVEKYKKKGVGKNSNTMGHDSNYFKDDSFNNNDCSGHTYIRFRVKSVYPFC